MSEFKAPVPMPKAKVKSAAEPGLPSKSEILAMMASEDEAEVRLPSKSKILAMMTSEDEAEPGLPSKADILAFMAREREAMSQGTIPAGKVGKREIARAFNIKGDARMALKKMLRQLESEGTLQRRGKRIDKAAALPNMIAVEIVARDRDGELVAKPTDWVSAEQGAAPRILVLPSRERRGSPPAVGVGDRALVRIDTARGGTGEGPVYTARVVKLLAKPRPRLLGIVRIDPRSGARVIPTDKRNASAEFTVHEGALDGAEDGELVAIEPMGRGKTYGLQPARVVERLGSTLTEHAVSTIAILTHGIPYVFEPDVLAEAERVRPATLEGREDWRELPLVTIDPPDAKDHDDAVHAVPDEAPDNAGGFILTVAIADVACLVGPGSALDRAAQERGNSVYFPDRVVPMLPERISTDLGSLRPLQDRPALAIRMVLGADGRKRSQTIHRVMMRSAAKLSYAQAQAAIDGQADDVTAPLLDPVLRPLWAAYRCAGLARQTRSPLDLDLPERKILLKPDGTVDRVVVPARLDAHRLIEEFMILANVAAAEALEARRQILVYRVHDEPSAAKIAALQEFLHTIGVKLAKGQVLRPALFNGILDRVRGSEHEYLVNEVVLRSQAQAEYAVENYGHFGLNLARYAHFTSPIRRYADLIVHRALIRAFSLGSGGLPDHASRDLGEIATRISGAERRAMAAERETTDRLIAGFLSDKIGHTFEGRIAGVTRAGFFVKLTETGADGFVPAATLGDEYFSYAEASRALVGTRTRKAYRLGDVIDVKLVEAAPVAGALRFEVVNGAARRKAERSRTEPGAARPSRKPEPVADAPPSGIRRSRRHKGK